MNDLERVRQYRVAARIAVRADTRVQDRYSALVELAKAARSEPGQTVRRWSESAVWAESQIFLGAGAEEHSYPPTIFELRNRSLRAEGYSRCPRCFHELPIDADFDRWRSMRAAHIEELRVREEAVR